MLLGPQIQRKRVQESPYCHGVAETTDQQSESAGKVCVKNVTRNKGSGKDMDTMKLVAKRHTVISKMAPRENIPQYFVDLLSKSTEKGINKPFWGKAHKEKEEATKRWRHAETCYVSVMYFFLPKNKNKKNQRNS